MSGAPAPRSTTETSPLAPELNDLAGMGARRFLLPLPARRPQANPVEVMWWGLHEAITRNHGCKDLAELLAWAERDLEEKQPFALHLGRNYQKLEPSPPKRTRVQLS